MRLQMRCLRDPGSVRETAGRLPDPRQGSPALWANYTPRFLTRQGLTANLLPEYTEEGPAQEEKP